LERHETRFRKRMRKEIERLKEQAAQLEGPEKEEHLQLIEMLEQNHTGAEEEDLLVSEQEQTWATIISVLNRIEQQVADLRQTLEAENARIESPEIAQRIVDQFSYDCQEAEKLMKYQERRGQLTHEQRAQLEAQLRIQVETMMALFRRSEPLTEAVWRSYTAQLFSV
jgi:hypothetical protein